MEGFFVSFLVCPNPKTSTRSVSSRDPSNSSVEVVVALSPISPSFSSLLVLIRGLGQMGRGGKSKKSRDSSNTIGTYAVQCGKCLKWRQIPSKEEYETIRQHFIEDPWYCNKKPNVSCNDPCDIEYDTSRVWAIDKPNLPKTPPGTQRLLSMRSDYSKMDVYYVMPNGKRIRSTLEVERFLDAFPEYKGKMSSADFSFTSPKVPEEMIPNDVQVKGASAKSKRQKAEIS